MLSPSTARFDRLDKMQVYARERVEHVWLVSPDEHVVEVDRLGGATWARVAAEGSDARVRLPPFDAIELDLALLWRD